MKEMLGRKVGLVTGAASGIGRSTALAFAREGARVAVVDVVREEGEETVRLIRDRGGEAVFIHCDVSKQAEVAAMVDATVATYGRLDCAFNNAGIGMRRSTIDLTEDDWDRVIDVNLKGVWLCMKFEILQMLKQGGGARARRGRHTRQCDLPGCDAHGHAREEGQSGRARIDRGHRRDQQAHTHGPHRRTGRTR